MELSLVLFRKELALQLVDTTATCPYFTSRGFPRALSIERQRRRERHYETLVSGLPSSRFYDMQLYILDFSLM